MNDVHMKAAAPSDDKHEGIAYYDGRLYFCRSGEWRQEDAAKDGSQ